MICWYIMTLEWRHMGVKSSHVIHTLGLKLIHVYNKERMKELNYWSLVQGIHRRTVHSQHKGPIMWTMRQCLNAIIMKFNCRNLILVAPRKGHLKLNFVIGIGFMEIVIRVVAQWHFCATRIYHSTRYSENSSVHQVNNTNRNFHWGILHAISIEYHWYIISHVK